MLPMTFMALIDDADDRDIFQMLWDKYERMLMAMAYGILGEYSLAEDAVSETFFKISKSFQKIHNFELSKIAAYAVIIIRNTCYDILASEQKYHKAAMHRQDDRAYEYDDPVSDTLILEASVEKLPDIYKDAVMLRYYYGFDINDISKQLGLTCSGVRFRIETALGLLRKELDDD